MSAILLIISLGYVGLLFGIAYWGDKRADAGRSLINNPYVYALSLAVYCTGWTFYGSVGRAASSGIGFLPIYLGPTLMAIIWVTVLRKIIAISKINHITSIADFIGSRYGKSTLLGGLVTIIAVFGTVPYLSLQLKAVSTSFDVIWNNVTGHPFDIPLLFHGDTTLLIALLLALFAILFATRSLDMTEHHEGMVLAIAFESIVKLLAFLFAGIFVSFFLFRSPGEIFQRSLSIPKLQNLMHFGSDGATFPDWAWLIFLSMMAIMFLPRQFQMAVVENVDEKHLTKATWLFPLYMLLINIFVLPIAFAGILLQPALDADLYVLTLPLEAGHLLLALFVFVGGLSASTGMVIVETVAVSTMVSNDLIMPVLLRWQRLRLSGSDKLPRLLLTIRRAAIVVVILLGYAYFSVARGVPLVSIGLISFAAVAQFAPALLGGIYWRRGSKVGAFAGLFFGFVVWAYTLPLPSLVTFGGLPDSFIKSGPLGITALRPYALFGTDGLDPISHSMMWSMLANVGSYIIVSLLSGQSILERTQATRFVDVFERADEMDRLSLWRSTSVEAVKELLQHFLGSERVALALADWNENSARDDAAFINKAEKLLGGAIGNSSAHILINTVVVRNRLTFDQVMSLVDETSQIIHYSRQLESQSQELAKTTADLRDANELLRELDTMKSNFMSMVTHELRTPLTSIRAFTEILYDNPDLSEKERLEFLGIIQSETERLTRLINNVLDFSKIESGKAIWLLSDVDLCDVINESVAATRQLFTDQNIELQIALPDEIPTIRLDHDRIVQVMLNLLSNAIKFCNPEKGVIQIALISHADCVRISVADNGIGIKESEISSVFERFWQAPTNSSQLSGTGLGLAISKQIIEHFKGEIWAESTYGSGATFIFSLPLDRTINHARESADR